MYADFTPHNCTSFANWRKKRSLTYFTKKWNKKKHTLDLVSWVCMKCIPNSQYFKMVYVSYCNLGGLCNWHSDSSRNQICTALYYCDYCEKHRGTSKEFCFDSTIVLSYCLDLDSNQICPFDPQRGDRILPCLESSTLEGYWLSKWFFYGNNECQFNHCVCIIGI